MSTSRNAIDFQTALSTNLSLPLSETQVPIRMIAVWTEFLSRGDEIPEIADDEKFIMEESSIDTLLQAPDKARHRTSGNATTKP